MKERERETTPPEVGRGAAMMMHAGEVARSGLAHTQQAARPPRKHAKANSSSQLRPWSGRITVRLKTAAQTAGSVEPPQRAATGKTGGRPAGRTTATGPPTRITSIITALIRHLVGRLSGVPRRFLLLLSCRVRGGTWLASVLRAALRGDPSGSFCGGVPHPCF